MHAPAEERRALVVDDDPHAFSASSFGVRSPSERGAERTRGADLREGRAGPTRVRGMDRGGVSRWIGLKTGRMDGLGGGGLSRRAGSSFVRPWAPDGVGQARSPLVRVSEKARLNVLLLR